MKIDTLEKLYAHELKDIYSAENQILGALPKMIEAASNEQLKAALNAHFKETQGQVGRITAIFSKLDFEPGGHKCKGIEGLLTEATENLRETESEPIRDAAIVSGCQRIEHYEIAAYGVARAFANRLGRTDDAALLTESIEEEGHSDRTLSQIAERHINFLAQVS